MTLSKHALKSAFVLICIFVFLILADMMFDITCGILPRDYTRSAMWVIKRRILRFAHKNDRLPINYEELSAIPNLLNETTDWWGNPIRYRADPEGIVYLESSGGNVWPRNPREGLPLMCSFPSKKPTGEWSEEMVNLTEESEKR